MLPIKNQTIQPRWFYKPYIGKILRYLLKTRNLFSFESGQWDISFDYRFWLSWHKRYFLSNTDSPYMVQYFIGPFVIEFEDAEDECFSICAECGGNAGEQGYGDEGLTVCEDCGSVDQGYVYKNKRQMIKEGLL